jgi:hypothetical protein
MSVFAHAYVDQGGFAAFGAFLEFVASPLMMKKLEAEKAENAAKGIGESEYRKRLRELQAERDAGKK